MTDNLIKKQTVDIAHATSKSQADTGSGPLAGGNALHTGQYQDTET